MKLSIFMKNNARKKYRYFGTHWGNEIAQDELSGEQIWNFLKQHKEFNHKMRTDPRNDGFTLDPRSNFVDWADGGFYYQKTGEIHHTIPGYESKEELILEQVYPLNKGQILQLVQVTAEAYFAIYNSGAYYPQVYYNLSSGQFGWIPSTDPLNDSNKLLIARLEQHCFGCQTGVLEWEDWNLYTQDRLVKWLVDPRFYYVQSAEDKIMGYERHSYTCDEVAVFLEKSAAAMRSWCAQEVFPNAYQLGKTWHIPIDEGQAVACFAHWKRFQNMRIMNEIFIGPY